VVEAAGSGSKDSGCMVVVSGALGRLADVWGWEFGGSSRRGGDYAT
jgi:hypothetical protein